MELTQCFHCEKPFPTEKLYGGGAVIRDGRYFCSRLCSHRYFVSEVIKTLPTIPPRKESEWKSKP